MVAISKTAGTTITSRFASGIGCGDDGCAISGSAKGIHIPEQAQIRRHGKDLRLEEVKQLIRRQILFIGGLTNHPLDQVLDSTSCGGRSLLTFLLSFLRLSLAFSLLLGLQVFVYRRPEAVEKVIKGTYAGNVVQGETAEDGIDGSSLHDVDPFREPFFRTGHKE
jgi:hypothetical protein